MKTIRDYVVIDYHGFKLVGRKCHRWLATGVCDVSEIIGELLEEGALIGLMPREGLHVLGSMHNPEIGLNGQVWSCGEIIDVMIGEDEICVKTVSGSVYHLSDPLIFSESAPDDQGPELEPDSDPELKVGLEPDPELEVGLDYEPEPEPEELSMTTDEIFMDPAGYLDKFLGL